MRIILTGFGAVGQALAKILDEDKQRLVETYGFEPKLTTIVDSHSFVSNPDGLDLRSILATKKKYGILDRKQSSKKIVNVKSLIRKEEAEVVVESTPSNFQDGEPGLSNIKEALTNGKHVVTSNKGPLALAMQALLELASYHNKRLLFSSTVGGGTPFLSFANKSMEGLKILSIHGILNGTTNYILSRMHEDKSLSFQKALLEAQKKGYAEKNPRNDVEGYDTAAKIVIIANWILHQNITLNDVAINGISKIQRRELDEASSTGKKIKLIGRVSQSNGATVKPEPVPIQDPLCVNGNLNALTFTTEHAGKLTVIGQGAGGEPTASAIIRDLMDIRREYRI